MQDLWHIPLADMEDRLGAEGHWLYRILRGQDSSDVNQRSANLSMMSSKNFRPGLTSTKDALRWLTVMSAELAARLREEREEYPSLHPRTLVLRYFIAGSNGTKSHQTPFGRISNSQLVDEINKRGVKLWNDSIGLAMTRIAPETLEVRVLSLSFSGIDRKKANQPQLYNFLTPVGPTTNSKRLADNESFASPARKRASKVHDDAHRIVKDNDAQCEMAEWTCTKCDHVVRVPVFENLQEDAMEHKAPVYIELLHQLREEHEHWHMALALADDAANPR